MPHPRRANRSALSPVAATLIQLGSPSCSQASDSFSPPVSPPAQATPSPLKDEGADPWVVFHEGFYYYTQTTGTNVTLWRSRTLAGLREAESSVVWAPPLSGPNSKNIWAPELHLLDGKWYIYFAADDGRNEHHRMFVLESVSSDPWGPYVEKGKIADESDRWAIDGTVLELEGDGRFFVWSGWEGNRNGQQNLYIARMANPWTLVGPRVLLSRPEYFWEWESGVGPSVNEGPTVLKRGGRTFVIYSADQSWTNSYKLGLLEFQGGDVLDSVNWRKWPFPVFESHVRAEGAIYAPGHCSFVTAEDGSDWIFFHSAKHKNSGWRRQVWAQRFSWNFDGTPNFGTPLLPVPATPILSVAATTQVLGRP